MAEIDIGVLTNGAVRNLSGHDRGLAARTQLRLDDFDRLEMPVRVIVPANLYALTTSFFQGMFAASVKRFGGRDAFLAHYRFDASATILRQIDRGISASLTERHSVVAA